MDKKGDDNYKEVINLVLTGKLRILSIVGPPRSASTLLEIALSHSPSVTGQCNEPFHLSPRDYSPQTLPEDPSERGWGEVLRRYEELKNKNYGKPVTMIIKEMAKNIAPGKQWDDFQNVSERILFLTRNPLQNIASLLWKMVETASPKLDLEEYAHRKGFNSWDSLHASAKEQQDFHLVEDVLEKAFFQANLYAFDKEMQQSFKKAHGHNKDIPHELAFWNTGWECLRQHIISTNKQYTIVDTDLLRLSPQFMMRKISHALGITFTDKMVHWENPVADSFDSGYGRKGGSSAYIHKSVEQSVRILPPTEVPIPIKKFPQFLQEHIKSIALPAYASMWQNPRMLRAGNYPIAFDRARDPLLGLLIEGKAAKIPTQDALLYQDTIHFRECLSILARQPSFERRIHS